MVAIAGAGMTNRAEPRACGHSREPRLLDTEPGVERNAGSASNAARDGGGRARSDEAGFQPYWGELTVRHDKRGRRKRGQDLMAIWHDARKGRHSGSHWSKPVQNNRSPVLPHLLPGKSNIIEDSHNTENLIYSLFITKILRLAEVGNDLFENVM